MRYLFILCLSAVLLPADIAWAAGHHRGHAIAQRWTFNWTTGFYPKCVPCRGVPDGPLAGNGDLGLVIGGNSGALGLPEIPAQRTTTAASGLGLYLGKNDFWGFPDAVTYHASFQHFSAGFLLMGLVDPDTADEPMDLPHFSASQRLADARLTAAASAPDRGYALAVAAVVLSDRNVILANVTATCPPGMISVTVNLTLGSDNPFEMPLSVWSTPPPLPPRLLSRSRPQPVLALTKSAVHGSGLYSPVLTPCSPQQIVYNGLRTFTVDPDTRTVSVINGTGAGSPPLCLRLVPLPSAGRSSSSSSREPSSGRWRVVTGSCGDPHSDWQLDQDGRIRLVVEVGGGALRDTCLGVLSNGGPPNVSCPPRSYYTSPSPEGACQSLQWSLLPQPCPTAACWSYDSETGFMRSLAGSAAGRCLTSVGPVASNNLAVAVQILGGGAAAGTADGSGVHQSQTAAAGPPSSARQVIMRCQCGATLSLAIGVVTQRDALERYRQARADPLTLLSVAAVLAAPQLGGEAGEGEEEDRLGEEGEEEEGDRWLDPEHEKLDRRAALLIAAGVREGSPPDLVERGSVSELLIAHTSWWSSFYDRGWVDLGGPGGSWPQLERFYFSMLYLMRGSMREGAVAPALWGPFSTSDTPQWSDDMTLDYNFQANFWGSSTANRPELVLLYAATLLDSRLVKLGRGRAASTAWAMGGWPDQYGAEVMGMSCGPTPDWDHGFGCEEGFGGFDGVAFVSCCGPFRGMECSFDDGTRFVAGLAATPLLQYYDATQDRAFLLHRLLPFMEQVAAFYVSYATWNASRGVYELRFTCAQEICASGLDPPLPEHNNHQDLAYARMALSRLLEFTQPGGEHGASADPAQRSKWALLLANLSDFPTAPAPDGSGPVFAEAETDDPANQPPATSNFNYPIAHLAAVFPALLVGPDQGQLLEIGRRTSDLMNTMTEFAPQNGFCLSWPPAALLATPGSAAALLHGFSHAYERKAAPNGWPDLGSGGLEQIGAIEALHALMLRTDSDGVISVFPAWPTSEPASAVSFVRLRARGAHLVSATWSGSTVASPVMIASEAGRVLRFRSPWSSTEAPCVTATRADTVDFGGQDGFLQDLMPGPSMGSWQWPTEEGVTYAIEIECGREEKGRKDKPQ